MGNRSSAHQPDDHVRSLVPYRSNESQGLVPLLPYEYELIQLAGVTEKEYRDFVESVRFKGLTRPAEYAHIPDVRNEGFLVSLAVSLIVGAISTGVSYLLQPKPPQLDTGRRGGRTIAGTNIQGQERFGTTSGFDSFNALANYADPIPVIFARRESNIGGVLATPALVWSRAFSLGAEQAVKMMFVVGEAGTGGINPPALEGVFLGNQPLDASYTHRFALYWNRVGGRMYANNLIYGTRGNAFSGDIEGNNDILLCPDNTAVENPAFSAVFSPVSNARFGCYGAMANGTGFRVNWRTVPMPTLDGDIDQNDRVAARERVKIAGDWGTSDIIKLRNLGMKGFGREYSRFMGVYSWNGQPFPYDPNADILIRHKNHKSAAVGDRIVYRIGGKVVPEDRYFIKPGTKDEIRAAGVDDINNATIQFREQADQTLQLGTTIMIGRTVWKVVGRSIPAWGIYQPNGKPAIGPYQERQEQNITLECVEVFGSDSGTYFGWVSTKIWETAIRTDDAGAGGEFYEGGAYPADNAWRGGFSVGPGFFPLMRVEFGVVRNTRACDCTEIGIRSQVWNRASGLCNFSSVPDPVELRKADKQGDTLNSGTFSGYFKRTSVWTILVRPAGLNQEGNPHPWVALGEQFCVRGAGPYDQYNFIRLIHPQRRQYEFRFLPKNGGDLAYNSPDDAVFWLLDAAAGTSDPAYKLQGVYTTAYGNFTVMAKGRTILKGAIEFNPEMSNGLDSSGYDLPDTPSGPTPGEPKPVLFNILSWLPDLDTGESKVATIAWNRVFLPETEDSGKESAFCGKVFLNPSSVGKTQTVAITFYEEPGRTRWLANTPYSGRWIRLVFTGYAYTRFPSNHPFEPNGIAWQLQKVELESSSSGFNAGEWLRLAIDLNSSDYRNWYNLDWVGVYVGISSTTQVQGAPGRESAFNYELFGEPMSVGVNTKRTVTRLVGFSGGRTTNAQFTAETVPTTPEWRNIWGSNRTHNWKIETVIADKSASSGAFGIGDTTNYVIGVTSSNPFGDKYLNTGVGPQLRVANVVTQAVGSYEIVRPEGLVDESVFTKRRVYERNSQITDMSMYLERTTSNESAPEHEIVYVNESIGNETVPTYNKLTTVALALRAGQSFTSADQLRVWLSSGTSVTQRFHPNDTGSGPSNMFPDLAYYLLTDPTAGLGTNFPAALIDTASFTDSCKFLRANKLFFNGAVAAQTSIRDYLATTAPYFLLAFVVQDGKFALRPALPTTSAGQFSTTPMQISNIFTAGNIVENTFKLEYISADQRQPFQAAIRWRDEQPNIFPVERTVIVRSNQFGGETAPFESIDLTEFCCSEDHAILVGKYLLALRRLITHTVSFKTIPDGMRLAPGDYIRVVTQSSPYSGVNNGVIQADGTVVATTPLEDGEYNIVYYNSTIVDPAEGVLSISEGKASDASLWNTVFSLNATSITDNVYQIEQLTIDEDGLVEIAASEHPTNSSLGSLLVQEILSGSFTIER